MLNSLYCTLYCAKIKMLTSCLFEATEAEDCSICTNEGKIETLRWELTVLAIQIYYTWHDGAVVERFVVHFWQIVFEMSVWLFITEFVTSDLSYCTFFRTCMQLGTSRHSSIHSLSITLSWSGSRCVLGRWGGNTPWIHAHKQSHTNSHLRHIFGKWDQHQTSRMS